jgi:hypothetical protein
VNAKTDDELYADYKGNVELPSVTTATIHVTPNGENICIFWYTRKTASLTIEKKGDTVDKGDTFIFDVKKGTELITTVTITGKGSVTVAVLKAGETYTVTEQENWSWRYTPNYGDSNEVTISSTGSKLTVTNTKSKTGWLSSAASAVNRWSNGEVKRVYKSETGGDA